ncbi:MAG: KpsF/GutQ family sugar-phosphate isomerase [Deltaproteobacteria bacterium]|nr:KpsF/GutQ family sugar-phosphate isomerase [Deltaproteobacteria bacterium]
MKEEILNIIKKSILIERDALENLAERVDENYIKALKILLECRGRVILSGIGKSGIVAKKIAATFASTGTPAIFVHPVEAAHGDLGIITEEDAAIFVSKSGNSQELSLLLPTLKRFTVPIISIVGSNNSYLAEKSDVVIDASVNSECGPIDMIPTASSVAALVVGDALAVGLITAKGFTKDDFALLHPGGALGKKLLLRVEDLMHIGDEIPVVFEETPMKDVIYEISSKKLGMSCVVDKEHKLRGIITDGDLRRAMEKKGSELFNLKAKCIMTRNPKIVNIDALAVKAAALMQSFSITSLVIVDKEKHLRGVIHLHDILRAGVL